MHSTESLWLLYTIGWYVLDPKDVQIDELMGEPDIVINNICASIARSNSPVMTYEDEFDCD